jgi:short-subunit dehydrogenase
VLATVRAFMPALRTHARSSIVNINSVVSLTNFSTACTYSDSKAASHSLTLGLRQILHADPIDVVSVHPGPIETDMTADLDMPKATAAYCANQILDGVETGAEEVFPDPFSVDLAPHYAAGPKVLEKRVREILGR